MKKINLLLLTIFTFGFIACNSSENQNEGENETETNTADSTETAKVNSDDAIFNLPGNAKVFFKNLEDGQEVSSPFTVEMGVEAMEIEPAGEAVAGKGHHHILINQGFTEERKIIAMAKSVPPIISPTDTLPLHYGKGQTETELNLAPGTYQLTMQFADGYHRSYGEQMSSSIRITVK